MAEPQDRINAMGPPEVDVTGRAAPILHQPEAFIALDLQMSETKAWPGRGLGYYGLLESLYPLLWNIFFSLLQT